MYQLRELKNSSLKHGFSDISEGNMSFRWGSEGEVTRNRRNFLRKMGIELENCVGFSIDHGTRIVKVGNSLRGSGMLDAHAEIKADGVATDSREVFLFLLTGDCLPIIVFDPLNKAVLLIHASRVNLQKSLLKQAVANLEKWYGSNPKNLIVGIGPGVRKESYELDNKLGREWGSYFSNHKLDLEGYAADQLESFGLIRKNIFLAPHDTIKNKNFFSHYRSNKNGEKEGRMGTVVGLG